MAHLEKKAERLIADTQQKSALLTEKQVELEIDRHVIEKLHQEKVDWQKEREKMTAENQAMKQRIKNIEQEDSSVAEMVLHDLSHKRRDMESYFDEARERIGAGDIVSAQQILDTAQAVSKRTLESTAAVIRFMLDGEIDRTIQGSVSLRQAITLYKKYQQALREENISLDLVFENPQETDVTLAIPIEYFLNFVLENHVRNARIAFIKNDRLFRDGQRKKTIKIFVGNTVADGSREIHLTDNAGGIPAGWAISRNALSGLNHEQKELIVTKEENAHALLKGAPETLRSLLPESAALFDNARPVSEAIFLGWFTTTDDKNVAKHNKGCPAMRFVVEKFLNGTLTEEGTPGEGTDFVIRYNETKTVQAPRREISPPGDIARIAEYPLLIIEDTPDFQEEIRQLFAPYLTTIHAVASVSNAKEKIRTHRPSLITLDLDLDDGSGFDILKDMSEEKLPILPIVVFSSNTAEKTYAQLRRYPFVRQIIEKNQETFIDLFHCVVNTLLGMSYQEEYGGATDAD